MHSRLIYFGTLAILACQTLWAQQKGMIYTPAERGMYIGEQRVGLWEYYDHPSQLSLVVDYSSQQLEYFEPDTSTFVVDSGNQWVKSKLMRPCRLHGSMLPYFEHYLKNLTLPFETTAWVDRKNKPIATILTFEIGLDGLATDPKVHGYKGFGIEKMMLKAFESAPNNWITGIKMDGTQAKCLMGISYKVCTEKGMCDSVTSTMPKVLFQAGRFPIKKKQTPGPFVGITLESLGIQFSPNGRKLLAEIANQGLIIPIDSGSTQLIPFSNIKDAIWLDNDRVYFKYQFSVTPTLMAEFDLRTGLVKTEKDSMTYFNIPSPDQSNIIYATYSDNGPRIWRHHLAKKQTLSVPTIGLDGVIPIGWSPDQQSIVLLDKGTGLRRLNIVDLQTDRRQLIPLLDASFCGWSKNGSIAYLLRTAGYDPVGELFAFDRTTSSLTNLSGKVRGMTGALFSRDAGQFILIIKGDTYLQRPGDEFRPNKIIDNTRIATWNPDGTQIALVNSKDRQLYIYNIERKGLRKLTDINYTKP